MEIRSYGDAAAPKITETGGRTVEGYAIVFNQPSRVLYDRQRKRSFVEVIEPRAVSEEFLRSCDVKFNRDHDNKILLGRSRYGEGTLKLSIDEYGVRYSCELPDTPAGNEVLEGIRRGDLFGSSFKFSDAPDGVRYEREKGSRGMLYRRTVSKFGGIYDVSVVADPAYYGTSVSARSFDGLDGEPDEDKQERQWGAAEELAMMDVEENNL